MSAAAHAAEQTQNWIRQLKGKLVARRSLLKVQQRRSMHNGRTALLLRNQIQGDAAQALH